MVSDFSEVDPNRIAAILYRPEDDVDALLANFAQDLVLRGERVGGIVQRNVKTDEGRKVGMFGIDLLTGCDISLCQSLGAGSTACKLDASGLAEASLAVGRAIEQGVDLIVINKFSKQEAAGRGFRNEIAATILSGIPLLIAVPETCFDAWIVFTGDIGTTLLCDSRVVSAWWDETSFRAGIRGQLPFCDGATVISRSSRPTI